MIYSIKALNKFRGIMAQNGYFEGMDYLLHMNKRRIRNAFTSFAVMMNDIVAKRATSLQCLNVFVDIILKEIMINKFCNCAKYFNEVTSKIQSRFCNRSAQIEC